MNETKNQQSKPQNGHKNQPPKKGQNPNDPQNQRAEHPPKLGVDDIKGSQQRQGIGTPHDKGEKESPHKG
jgi:hypothetical protein